MPLNAELMIFQTMINKLDQLFLSFKLIYVDAQPVSTERVADLCIPCTILVPVIFLSSHLYQRPVYYIPTVLRNLCVHSKLHSEVLIIHTRQQSMGCTALLCTLLTSQSRRQWLPVFAQVHSLFNAIQYVLCLEAHDSSLSKSLTVCGVEEPPQNEVPPS